MSSDSLIRLTTALASQYRIESELGEGGMATVCLAHDIKHDRQVAEWCPFMAPLRGMPEFVRITAKASCRVAEFSA